MEDRTIVAEAIRDLSFVVGVGLVQSRPVACCEGWCCFFEGVELEAFHACMLLTMHCPYLDGLPICLNSGLLSLGG